MAEVQNPDLILVDIMVRKMDGCTFQRTLRTKPAAKSVPVMVVTAKPGMREVFQVEGTEDYLVKPFEDEKFLFSMRRAMRESKDEQTDHSAS